MKTLVEKSPSDNKLFDFSYYESIFVYEVTVKFLYIRFSYDSTLIKC